MDNKCSRCNKENTTLTLSFINTDMICKDCKKKEMELSIYNDVREIELSCVRGVKILDLDNVEFIKDNKEGFIAKYKGIPMQFHTKDDGDIEYLYSLNKNHKEITVEDLKNMEV